MGHLLRNIMTFRREMADFVQANSSHFRIDLRGANIKNEAAGNSQWPLDDCLTCYPFLGRFAHDVCLPAAFSFGMAKFCCRGSERLAFGRNFADSCVVTTPIKGRKSCLKHPTSSQQLRCFLSQLASKMTANAQSLAQASAALLAKQSATTTVSKAPLLAASLAHCLTTSKSICRKATEIIETAAAGQPCVRRFCF